MFVLCTLFCCASSEQCLEVNAAHDWGFAAVVLLRRESGTVQINLCLARLGWSFEILMQTETCGGFHSVWFTTESKVKCKQSTSACVWVFSAQEKSPKNVFFLGQPLIVLVAVLWSVFFVLIYDFSLFYFTSLWFHCACITSVRFWLLTADFLLCLVLEVSPHFC